MTELSAVRDAASAEFFDAAARAQLLIRHCPACGAHFPPQTSHCGDHDRLEWKPASGTGVLVTWAVDHGPPVSSAVVSPSGDPIVGIVELDEGPWIRTAILAPDANDLEDGTPLVVDFVRPDDGEWIPVFRPKATEQR